ncbi:MAG: serine/threonine-protein kinase, partial [Dokdonella sp.]
MHRPVDPDPTELRAWLESDDRARRLAGLLFRNEHGEDAIANDSHGSMLGLAQVENLDLDLTDPAQRTFGDYELLERVGRGGMGVVYRARQLSLDRDVALKVLAAGPWAGVDFIDRLRNEARHAARLAHPHIVSVFDVGQHDAFCFYTMRLVEGESLRERLARVGPISHFEAVRIAQSIAQALAYAHGIGVLHLDIKPANILLDNDEEPHLADFGLAQRHDQEMDQCGAAISGTPQYMAPEQAAGTGQPLSESADVFSLGATLFEMLAGRPPLSAGLPREVLRQLLNDDIPRLRDIVPQANRELDAICARCLAHDPAQRYASATELADDLRRWQLHRPVRAMRDRWLYRTGKFLRRNRLASALTAMIIAIVTVAMFAMAWQVRETSREAEWNLQIKEQLIQLFLQPEDHQLGTGQKPVSEFLDEGAERLQRLPLGSKVRGELAGVIVGIYLQLGRSQSAATLAERELGGAPVTAETAARADLRLVTGWAQAHYGLSEVAGLSAPLASAIAHSADTRSRIYLDALITQTRIAIASGDFASSVRTGELTLSLMQQRAASKVDIASAHMELAAAYVGIRQPRKGREHSEIALVEIGSGDSVAHVNATTMAGLRRALFGEFASAQVLFDDGAAQWQ